MSSVLFHFLIASGKSDSFVTTITPSPGKTQYYSNPYCCGISQRDTRHGVEISLECLVLSMETLGHCYLKLGRHTIKSKAARLNLWVSVSGRSSPTLTPLHFPPCFSSLASSPSCSSLCHFPFNNRQSGLCLETEINILFQAFFSNQPEGCFTL